MILNQIQQTVYDWLHDDLDLPVFAEAYWGAVELISIKSPGYVSFVAHAGRDLMNGLAAAVEGIKRQQVQYVQLVDEIRDYWNEEWNHADDLLSEAEEQGYFIPLNICKKIGVLVKEHSNGRQRSSEADGLFFSAFLDYTDKDRIPANFLSEWKAAKKWFRGHAHLSEKPFKANTDQTLVEHFNCLDGGGLH